MLSKPGYLPEGVDVLLPEQVASFERLRGILLRQFRCWGYAPVMPPLLEYQCNLQDLGGEPLIGRTFTLIDPLDGSLLGLPDDLTPQVARLYACHLRGHTAQRLCYIGHVLRAIPDSISRTRALIQAGAERYGQPSEYGDLEVLRLMLTALEQTGVSVACLDMGHVGIYQHLIAQAALQSKDELALLACLQSKSDTDLHSLLQRCVAEPKLRAALQCLPGLHGGFEVLQQARTALADMGDPVMQALQDVQRLAERLQSEQPKLNIQFDFSETRGFHYKTGLVFSVFVAGHSDEVARGGRYQAGVGYGDSIPATGFSMDVSALLLHVSADQNEAAAVVHAPYADDADLHQKVSQLRSEGRTVVYFSPGSDPTAASGDERLLCVDGAWTLQGR